MSCPPGFDCAFANSCPSFTLDCPPGFFCSSYAGLSGQSDMDYEYALFKTNFGGSDESVTRKNAKKFIDPDRAIQNSCLFGFYCPDSVTMEACPSGHWCPERTIQPQKCDDLSVCGKQAGFQVNFVNPVIMFGLLFLALACSFYLKSSQRSKNTESQKKDPGARVASPIESETVSIDEKKRDMTHELFEVRFENLQCEIAASKYKILPGISGRLPAGKITALMGPTASGKSTMMNFLRHGQLPISTAGKVQYLIRSPAGVRELSASDAQPFIGHVPQEDIFDRNLTIRELLTFNAKARSRTARSATDIQKIVDDVLADLAIQHVADSIIGGGENAVANISGGQLKRVNIACELVALQTPGLLLLDEPTAGLDAAIAYELMQTLEALKKKGITICMVIQQPRSEIFERFDHLMLMNNVGGLVFEGASSAAVPYLLQLGYAPNPDASDADYCLDILNGLRDSTSCSSRKLDMPSMEENRSSSLPRSTAVLSMEDRLDCTKLHLLWQEVHNQSVVSGHNDDDIEASSSPSTSSSHAAVGSSEVVYPSSVPTHAKAQEKTNSMLNKEKKQQQFLTTTTSSSSSQDWWRQFLYHSFLHAQRLVTVRLRHLASLLVYVCIDVVMALALSVGFTIFLQDTYRGVFAGPVDVVLRSFFPSPLHHSATHNAASLGFSQLLFFMSSALGSSSALSAVPVFSGMLPIVCREDNAGISLASFALGRMSGDVCFVLLHGFVFAGVWMLFGHAGHYYNWIGVILSTSFAASGIGYIASAANKQSTASTWAIVAAFIASVFAGIEPSLTQVSKYPVVSWPWYLNFATWTAEATYYTWTQYWLDNGVVPIPLQAGADVYGYNLNGIGRSVGAMLALGVGMRLVAVAILYRRVKHLQQ